MWINRAEYENLENEAKKFCDLVKYIKEKKTVVYRDFIMMSYDTWNEVLNKCNTSEDRIKEIEAELEWYKVKYHEMKMNKE